MKRSFTEFVFLLFSVSTMSLISLAAVVEKGQDVLLINSMHSPLSDVFFSAITVLGEGLLFVPIIIYLLFVQFRYAILAAIICVGHSILCLFIKRGLFSHADRPIAVLDNTCLHFVPNIDVHSMYSFPSGHTATIFCLAMFMSLIVKRKSLSVLFLVIALLVGYSRIYLLQHFLIDVAAGATIGVVFTLLAWKLFESDTPEWMNGSLARRLQV